MEPLAISWLIASSSSPLIAVLALWTIYVFHTFRRRWRTVDLFLLTVISQELVIAIFTFCYAIIRLINPPFRTPCNFNQWGLIAARTFQVATLTSMVVDRSLTVRWPYRYRFSVRRNQIRYHIAVLVLVSVLVGVAAVFARSSIDGKFCSLQPSQWDIKYIVFLLSLYGVLMLISFICMVQVEIYRNKHGTKLAANGSFQLPECASPDLPSATGMNSPLDTQSSTGSTRALHRPSRQASRRPYGKNSKGTSDLRWPSVALTSLICFSLNHIPHLVLMSIATWSPLLWSSWHEAILMWLGLLEGVFVPLLLFCKDHAIRNALRRTFQRRSGALSPLVGDDGPFQMYFDKDHFRKRGTFGSVTPIGIITNYRRTPGKKRRCKKSGSGAKYTLPGLHSGDSVLAKSCFSAGFLGNEPLSKLSCADLTSLEMWREEDEENFYATLSDDFSTFSCKSADDSALSEDMRISEELYGGSFTTIANDDFEFHDTRPCGGEVKMKPALASTPPHTNSFNAGFSRNVSFRENMQKNDIQQTNISQDKGNELFDLVTSPDDEDQKDPSAFILPITDWNYKGESETTSPSDPSSRDTTSNKFGTMSRHQKTTSFSMNDLDLIHQRANGNTGDIEATFMLPVKSESTMSLYRLNVDRDLDQMVLTPSKSENNVNGDSGFGSGAQSTNPVWSGFLCRKPSDPFWNMRKPTVHAATAVTPTRNYPGILHPRMRKIPWITAWKKLDEGSDSYKRSRSVDTQSKDNTVLWNDTPVYSKKIDPLDNHVSTIEEELSDVGTPIFNGDYNLNIFAKESGVLLENAFGKIERDDCGVKVNFYGENVQYDTKDGVYGNKESTDNIFDTSFESDKAIYDSNRDSYEISPTDINKVENYYEPLNVKKNDSNGLFLNDTNVNIDNRLSIERVPCEDDSHENTFRCELRLNGGHYENLFGTKENIFAQCDQYKGKVDVSPRNSKLERRASGRRDSGRLKKPNSAYYHLEANSLYGQLKKVERKESFTRKTDELPELQSNDVIRKESDNRGKKCGIKRRESKTRNDRRPEIPKPKSQFQNSNFTEFDNREIVQDDKNRNQIEIEMKSVYGRNDLNYNSKMNKIEVGDDFRIKLTRRESQNRKTRDNSLEARKPRLDNQYAEVIDERGVKIIRRESQSRSKERSRDRKIVDDCERIYAEPKDILWQTRVERRDSDRRISAERIESERRVSAERREGRRRISLERSESGRQANAQRKDSGRCVERRNSDRCANIERRESGRISRIERRENVRLGNSQIERKESGRQNSIYSRREDIKNGIQRRDSQNRKTDVKNEGLWVNAIPFHVQNYNEEENGNTPKRESRKEAYDLNRSPRKSNLARKESRSRNEKPTEPIKRKISANRGRKEKFCQEQPEDSCPDSKILRKEHPKWPPRNNVIKSDSHFDDFIKYRDKCEDNFSHIQNINRETSAEREQSKMEQFITYGKLNGNVAQNGEVFPFDTFQEQKRPLFQSSKPVSDINDNCGQKKLAITDFL